MHHRVLVVGGGNGGISLAARLRRQGVGDVTVVDPALQHRYKPLFSHVAGGTARASETVRRQADVIPRDVRWIPDAVTAVDPDASSVTLRSGEVHTYEHLVLAPGIELDWDRVPGLDAALAASNVVSNYTLELAEKASRVLRGVTGGTVVFTQPDGPASCAGAAQKPMYQACDYWERTGVLGDIRVILVVPTATVFGLAPIDHELQRSIDRYGIELRVSSDLAAVDTDQGTAVIAGPSGEERIRYEVLHAVPPQSAPRWIADSSLADAHGFVEVDVHTLRHPRFPNVWALGDAAGTANSKCGGALRKQSLVVAKNLVAVLRGRAPSQLYDGYGVCPMTVSRSSVVWAEFDDTGVLKPTIPFWRTMYRESRLSWIFDRRVLPWVYWNLILTGRV